MILLERERLLSELEQTIGYSFRSRALLDRALTHRSFANERADENCQHNEAMEFLGDSVLGFVVSAWLLERFPDFSEGKLSKMKAYLVSESSLVELAGEIDLGKYILLNRGEEKTGGRRKHALLADAYEALIGVLYVDGGTVVAERFLRRELGEKLMSIDPASMIGADYKSALQERLQAAGGTVPEYAVVEVTGPDHRRTFRVELRVVGEALATGEGHPIKIAQQEAARAGLENDSLPRVIEAIKLSQKRELEAESEHAPATVDTSLSADADSPRDHGSEGPSEGASDGEEAMTHFPNFSTRAGSLEETAGDSLTPLLASPPASTGSIEAGDASTDAETEIGLTKF
ncbi:MAG TPA: ribonuclease III [Blastocatellia bacterium]|nr:ribonuclease III [Blastocatellia bacterium]